MAKLPKFKSEAQEREYWDQHSPLDHLDELSPVEDIEVKERAPKIQISLRIRPDLKDGIEKLAAQKGIPYQTLIHSWIMERFYAETEPGSALADPQLEAWIEKLVDKRVRNAEQRLRRQLHLGPARSSKSSVR